MEKKYTAINLPIELVEELKAWRTAFSFSYGRPVTYEKMLRSMLDCLEDTEPAVFSAMEQLLKLKPELARKLGKFGVELNSKENR